MWSSPHQAADRETAPRAWQPGCAPGEKLLIWAMAVGVHFRMNALNPNQIPLPCLSASWQGVTLMGEAVTGDTRSFPKSSC